jgi:hypothetical protein
MMSAKKYAFRPSSKPCSSCQDLREAALRNARNLYRAAVKTTDAAAQQNLEEELKQTSAAHKSICYAVHAHLTKRGVRLAA